MAGHSKWAKIKRKKAATDAKKGKLYTKLLREIQVAAKLGGGDPAGNPRLKTAILSAKQQGVPTDNIDRAIKRGSGNADGVDYEEALYEGYGPSGVAVLVNTLTDNKNRTVAEVRHVFSKYGGSLASANAVAYLFERKGVFSLKKELISEEILYDKILEAGAEDIEDVDSNWQIISPYDAFDSVRNALEALNVEFEGELTYIPTTLTKVSGKDAETLLKFIEALEDLDDVQNVTANFDIDDQELERITQ